MKANGEKSKIDLARKLLAQAFPHDQFLKMEIAKEGWDNLVVLADDKWVFRIPQRLDYPRHEERWVLERLRNKLSLAIPSVERWSDDPPCMGYPLLAGVPATGEWLEERSGSWAEDLGRDLAHFLYQCHQTIGFEEAKTAGLREFQLSSHSFHELLGRAKGMDPEHQRFAESFLKEPVREGQADPSRFLYGDLHFGNMLFDPNTRKVVAILDFGNASWGGLSSEFYDLSGSWPTLCDVMIRNYEKLSSVTVDRRLVLKHAVTFCLSVFADEKMDFFRQNAARRMDRLIESSTG